MSMQSYATRSALSPVRVWDLPTRLFHWLVALLVAAEYLTARLNWMGSHVLAGEALLALLLFRLVWGLIGSDTSRFSRFVAAPRQAIHHLAGLFRREPDRQIGHNAAGGWMVLLLLALLLGQTLTGIIANNDVADGDGPLTDLMPAWLANLVTDLHSYLWDALLVAVALHVTAIALYAAAKGHNLVGPMLSGRKRLARDQTPPRLAPLAWSLPVLAGSAVVAALLVNYL
jgi:cytochrome b